MTGHAPRRAPLFFSEQGKKQRLLRPSLVDGESPVARPIAGPSRTPLPFAAKLLSPDEGHRERDEAVRPVSSASIFIAKTDRSYLRAATIHIER